MSGASGGHARPSLLPIPMRGNEKALLLPLWAAISAGLPIPMRGNEVVQTSPSRGGKNDVTDPHEG